MRPPLDAPARLRRHASFQMPVSEMKPFGPRRSEMSYVPMFEHHAPKAFEESERSASDVYDLPAEDAPTDEDPQLASFATRSYANVNRIKAAAETVIAVGSPQSVAAARARKTYAEMKGPKRPYPQEYDGSTDPMKLHEWTTRVSLWFNGERISPNSIEGTTFLGNFFEKVSKAASWYATNVLGDMSDFLRYMEAKGIAVDPSSPSPWPLDDVLQGLRKKFISRTFGRDVDNKFANVYQSKKATSASP